TDSHLSIEAARPQQRGIENVRPIRRGDDHNALVLSEPVHLDQQLVERLLPLFMAQRVAAPASADGVQLVDEHDAGWVTARVTEQLSNPGGADAGVHLDEVRAAREEKRHFGFPGDRTGEKRLARTRLPDEEDALGYAAANGRKAGRLAQEVDDFLHFLLGLVDARDVGKR